MYIILRHQLGLPSADVAMDVASDVAMQFCFKKRKCGNESKDLAEPVARVLLFVCLILYLFVDQIDTGEDVTKCSPNWKRPTESFCQLGLL